MKVYFKDARMPAPLLWLSVGALALLAKTKYSNDRILNDSVDIMPGMGDVPTRPKNGAVVCCGVFGWFIHTGIWLDGNIIELRGNGLIRAISPARFLHERSGEHIYIACDPSAKPLIQEQAIIRAAEKIFSYSEYDLIDNNCHKFVWQCLSGESQVITRFSELNLKMSEYFKTTLAWQPILNY